MSTTKHQREMEERCRIYIQEQGQRLRQIRAAREADTAAAEARKGQTVEQIIDDGFDF